LQAQDRIGFDDEHAMGSHNAPFRARQVPISLTRQKFCEMHDYLGMRPERT
jgi:hypothetical protein